MRRFKSDSFLEEKRARKSLAFTMTLQNRVKSQTSRKSSPAQKLLLYMWCMLLPKNKHHWRRHYYFKLGKEKLVDSEAKFKAGAS